MQSIPVDVARLGTLMCVVPPEPKLMNQETGEVRRDRDGNTVYTVGVSVRQDGRRASVIEIAVSGEPAGISEGVRVQVTDLQAFAWAMGDRHGMSFRAAAISPVSTSRAAAPTTPAAAPTAGKGGGAG